jgi:hypothetical protein
MPKAQPKPVTDKDKATEARKQRQKDDAYRAVGRYVVEFSRLIFQMRTAMEIRLGTEPPMLGILAFGEATAAQVANACFAMCETAADLDDDEQKVADWLRKAVRKEIETRNDFAHGDWWIGWVSGGEPDNITTPWLDRIKPSRRKGARVKTEISVAELDERSEKLIRLRNLVAQFAQVCLVPERYAGYKPVRGPKVRVGDFLIMRAGEVVREGPLGKFDAQFH